MECSEAKISVIVTAYNLQDRIARCLNSVLQQDKANVQLIVIDDGSTDGTRDEAKRVCDTDNRAVLISTNNRGVSHARSVGLKASNGDYVCFIDGDDWLEKDYCKKMIAAAQKYDAEIVVCRYAVDTGGGKALFPPLRGDDIAPSVIDAVKKIHTEATPNGYLWNKLFSREVLENISFPSREISFGEDYQVLCQALSNARCVKWIDDVLYNYCYTEGSASHSQFHPGIVDSFFAYKRAEENLVTAFPTAKNEIGNYMVTQRDLALMLLVIRSDDVPGSFVKLCKDDLRRHLLSFLNSSYSVVWKVGAAALALMPGLFSALYKSYHFIKYRQGL